MVSATVHAEDVPIVRLKPLSERKIRRCEYERIKASIEAVGLIEPLVVSPENGSFLILDGVQRYRILLELGVEAAPCIIRQEKPRGQEAQHGGIHRQGVGQRHRRHN